MIEFEVPGKPQGKGRPRFARMGAYVKTYTPAETESYENLIKLSCAAVCKNPLPGPLRIVIMAYYPIANSWSNKKKNSALNHQIRPTVKPDYDNVAKVVCDSLNGIAYKDDTQIVEAHAFKYYSERPRLEVQINEINTEVRQ